MNATRTISGLAGAAILMASHAAAFAFSQPLKYDVTTGWANEIGTTWSVDWIVPAGTVGDAVLPYDLTATATFTVVSPSDLEDLILDIEVTNTTVIPAEYPTDKEALLSFGFELNPEPTDLTADVTTDGAVFDDGAVVNGFPVFNQVNVCVWSSNGCNGGGIDGGLQAGNSDTLTLTLTAPTASWQGTPMFTLGTFVAKFQGEYGSFEVECCDDKVPEPAPLALVLAGVLGVMATRRRLPGGRPADGGRAPDGRPAADPPRSRRPAG